jgi:hypothetical protein
MIRVLKSVHARQSEYKLFSTITLASLDLLIALQLFTAIFEELSCSGRSYDTGELTPDLTGCWLLQCDFLLSGSVM